MIALNVLRDSPSGTLPFELFGTLVSIRSVACGSYAVGKCSGLADD